MSGDRPLDAYPWHQGQILTIVAGEDPTAAPGGVVIQSGAGQFRMTCLPQQVIEAPLQARDVVVVRQVTPGGELLVERSIHGAPDRCWFVLRAFEPLTTDTALRGAPEPS